MSGHIWLDWALLAVSLFNMLLLLWLGLTVFLNAERRSWGIWLSSGGLLLGALFFLSHTAILGSEVSLVTPGLNFWWHIGWFPVAALPFLWYLAMLWYAGYWEPSAGSGSGRGGLYQRQHVWFALVVLCGLLLVGLLVFANPLPSLGNLTNDRLSPSATTFSAPVASVAGLPVLILVYPLYTLFCMVLSIDALRHPQVSGRLMGELARRRARRWLSATALVLLVVGLLVGWVMIWIVGNAGQGIFSSQFIVTVGWFDLAIASLISVSVLLLGQAVVAYEVFTGKTLPRRGLAQYWHRAVILAAGFSLIGAGSLTAGLRPIYTLLLAAHMVVAFLALLGWRAFAERQRLIDNLRPFAASQGIVEHLLREGYQASQAQSEEMEAPFLALCANLLETRRAGLFPYGPLALLSGPPVLYPPEIPSQPLALDRIAARFQESAGIGLALESGESGDWVFAVPLWRLAGLSGVILLGQKQSGSPYTQEEIEIVQATGERLIDTRASAEMARRLVTLQRRQLAASRIADQRLRRAVHDEILPQVHTLMLDLAGSGTEQSDNGKVIEQLHAIHSQLADLLGAMPPSAAPEVEILGLVEALRRTLSGELSGAFDAVEWTIDPRAEALASSLPPLCAEVLFAAAREGMRNAALHGRGDEEGYRLCLQVSLGSDSVDGLRLTLADNGVGFVMHSTDESASDGLSASRAGSGQGLALHSTLMAVIGGSLTLSSRPGESTCLVLELPRWAWEG
ncbi:MAG: sensor histidine kinase [Anaerolineales bacterium]